MWVRFPPPALGFGQGSGRVRWVGNIRIFQVETYVQRLELGRPGSTPPSGISRWGRPRLREEPEHRLTGPTPSNWASSHEVVAT